jgi:succinate dehydrogenase / fumarate reductase flavoprotein subunit
VGPGGQGVYLDFRDAIAKLGRKTIEERYGNLFDMYHEITDEDAYQVPMRIYPAPHYTMGGLWVDYNLMSTVPGLFVIGEANFSDHGANRLGASALMQGLADGYFILPHTVAGYLAGRRPGQGNPAHPAFQQAHRDVEERTRRLLNIKGRRSVDELHRELGKLMWNECGMARSAAGLNTLQADLGALRDSFWKDVSVLGRGEELNQGLEKAGRVADLIEFAQLLVRDALHREESCGGHFRVEHQTPDGEAKRDDARFCYAAAWQYQGEGQPPVLHKEPLTFEQIPLAVRSYK